jgi:hypothetical protein
MYLTLSNGNRYKVTFVSVNTLVFKKGPKRRQPREHTICKIIHLAVRGDMPFSQGEAWQSWRDEPCMWTGRVFAMDRALRASTLSREQRSEFWVEFHKRYVKPVKDKFSNAAEPGVPADTPTIQASTPVIEPKKQWWKFWRK